MTRVRHPNECDGPIKRVPYHDVSIFPKEWRRIPRGGWLVGEGVGGSACANPFDSPTLGFNEKLCDALRARPCVDSKRGKRWWRTRLGCNERYQEELLGYVEEFYGTFELSRVSVRCPVTTPVADTREYVYDIPACSTCDVDDEDARKRR